MKENEDTPPRKTSSWSAAIAQLPGFPEEAKPKLPPVADGKARAVSSGMSEEDEAGEAPRHEQGR